MELNKKAYDEYIKKITPVNELGSDMLHAFVTGGIICTVGCICFMGGDADPKYVSQLSQYLHREHPKLKVAWYSGRR